MFSSVDCPPWMRFVSKFSLAASAYVRYLPLLLIGLPCTVFFIIWLWVASFVVLLLVMAPLVSFSLDTSSPQPSTFSLFNFQPELSRCNFFPTGCVFYWSFFCCFSHFSSSLGSRTIFFGSSSGGNCYRTRVGRRRTRRGRSAYSCGSPWSRRNCNCLWANLYIFKM